MPATKLELRVVTAERLFLEESVDEVVLPGIQGEFGVLPDHTPLLAALGPGEARYRKDGAQVSFYLAGGFAEVLPDRVTVLADSAALPNEIDSAAAERDRIAAEAALQGTPDPAEFDARRLDLDRALARLQVSGKRAPQG